MAGGMDRVPALAFYGERDRTTGSFFRSSSAPPRIGGTAAVA